jgi:ADP-dependent NAD(P)H-hydrate dehydratase / NAD(P)H-hydrate epimerase
MQPVLTAAEMRQLDAFTIDTLGLDGRILMSNAGRAVLEAIRRRWPNARRLLILCGLGNNGGDGLALAYYAHQCGLDVHGVICAPDSFIAENMTPDCGFWYDVCKRAFVPLEALYNPPLLPELISRTAPDVIVDAIFGTGVSRDLTEFHVELIKRLNMTSRPIVAIDLPSGMSCDSGMPRGAAVEADLTVTFGCSKLGLFHPNATAYTGEVELAEIGLAAPSEAGISAATLSVPSLLWEPLRAPRKANTHKGDYGKVLVVAGHQHYPGAPRLAAEGALRMGAGLVRLVVPESIYNVSCGNPAIMVAPHYEDGHGGFSAEPEWQLNDYLQWADALVIGPGLGTGDAKRLVRTLLESSDIPTVVDADALLAAWGLDAPRRWPLLMTPHAGELARLLDILPEQLERDWFDAISHASTKHGVYLLAKANQTALVTPDGDMYFPGRGHPALAVGGSGDVLAGMLAALLARLHVACRDSPVAHQCRIGFIEAVVSAVNVHAQAAELLAEELGDDGAAPLDLIEALPRAVRHLAQCRAL